MQLLKANAAVDVLIGPFVDDTDGKTAETALTLSQADIKLSKNGQALAQKNDVTAASHDANGYYNCELDATDTNTEGTLVLIVHESGALPVRHEFMVLAEAAYDSMFAAKDTGYMDVNVKAVSEDTAAADNLESACDNYSATRGLAGTALPAAAADAAGGIPISDAGGLDLDTILGRITANVATATALATVDTVVDAIKAVTDNLPNSGALSDLAAILADTNELQTNQGNWVTATGFATAAALATVDGIVDAILVDTDITIPALIAALNDLSAADVNAEVDTALAEIHLDHLLAANYDPASKPGVATALLNELVESDGGVSRFTENALEQAPSGTGASAASIADAVWDEARGDHVGVGSFGEEVQAHALSSEISALNDPTPAEIRAEIDSNSTQLAAILEDTGTSLPATLATIAGYLDAEIAAILADTNELQANQGNWATATGFATEAKQDIIDAVVDAIKAVTDNLPNSGALTDLATAAVLATVDAVVDAIKLKTDNLPSGVQKNEALSNFEFLMVDSTDHVAAKTGLTVTAQISKDGGAFAGCSNAVSEIGSGVYVIDLTQAEMNADVITLKFTAAGADQRTVTIKTSS